MGYKVERCPEKSLGALVDQGARKLRERQLKHRPSQNAPVGFRASGLSSCLRMRGYELAGAEATDDTYHPDYALAAEQGTIIHEHLQRWLREAGLLYNHPEFGPAVELSLRRCCNPQQKQLLERLQFSGHIDAVLEMKGKLAILDIKTVASKYIGGDGTGIEYPWLKKKLQSYAVQLHAYMAFFGAPDGRIARDAYVWMVSRDDTRHRRLYHVPWQEEAWAVELARLEAAHAAVTHGDLPVAEPERGGCIFCRYQQLCRVDAERPNSQ